MINPMSTLSVRLPESIHKKLKMSADKDGVSINQFITLAITEKLAVLETVELLKTRAERATVEAFEQAINSVPDVPAPDFDAL
jgi:hypothetical protein